MRILSLGFPMPGPQVDNHSFASAPVFFDYDAIVVNPLALSQFIEEVVSGSKEHTTPSSSLKSLELLSIHHHRKREGILDKTEGGR